ncbi:MAG: hypothetical protein QOF61_2490, partial [Acidobacteriota bacterium]|nr:hypothetical protein [Acidobacteriota bacterium]
CRAQSVNSEPGGGDVAAQKALLLADLQSLEIVSAKLDKPLARAAAVAEIASAAWTLDDEWSKKLLREAYELTLPEEKERESLRAIKIGAPLTFAGGDERARNVVRHRVLEVAGRDKAFADELITFGGQQLGAREQHYNYAQLASQAARGGDLATAGDYAMRALDAEPTILNAGTAIAQVATRDRGAADQLILRYIERLRSLPLSLRDDSTRAIFLLDMLILYYKEPFFRAPSDESEAAMYRQTPPPGAEVMRAYVGYVIESMSDMERREPGSSQRLRGHLGLIWSPLRRYAPELTPAFTELERLSRKPGSDDSLPSLERRMEDYEKQYERRVKDALASDYPDEMVIQSIISHGDFAKAHKLIDKLPDGAQKTQLLETINAREALALLAKGDEAGAEQLAERLQNASFILQVYPSLLKACVAAKDQGCATRVVYQAVRQLKRADTTPPALPEGIPAAAMVSNREIDRALLSLSQLAAQVAPFNEILALELSDEIVAAANRSEVDTGQGRTGFDAGVFKALAARNEPRARQAAEGFKDRLRQIVAFAAIDQAKAEALNKNSKPKS